MKKFLSIFLLLIMVVSLSACASPQNEKPEEPTPPSVDEPNENDEDEDVDNGEDVKDQDEEDVEEQEAEKEAEVNIYFTSEEYVITGNEDLENILPEKRKVTYGDITLEEAVVRELLKQPESGELINSIPESIELIEVKVTDNTAYVDFSKDGMQGGRLEEDLTINQIIISLLDLGTVQKVQFLLDGEVSDTLMGHVPIAEPFDQKFE